MTFASLAEKTIALITPNIATSSQKMILAHPIRMGGFFEEGAGGGWRWESTILDFWFGFEELLHRRQEWTSPL